MIHQTSNIQHHRSIFSIILKLIYALMHLCNLNMELCNVTFFSKFKLYTYIYLFWWTTVFCFISYCAKMLLFFVYLQAEVQSCFYYCILWTPFFVQANMTQPSGYWKWAGQVTWSFPYRYLFCLLAPNRKYVDGTLFLFCFFFSYLLLLSVFALPFLQIIEHFFFFLCAFLHNWIVAIFCNQSKFKRSSFFLFFFHVPRHFSRRFFEKGFWKTHCWFFLLHFYRSIFFDHNNLFYLCFFATDLGTSWYSFLHTLLCTCTST